MWCHLKTHVCLRRQVTANISVQGNRRWLPSRTSQILSVLSSARDVDWQVWILLSCQSTPDVPSFCSVWQMNRHASVYQVANRSRGPCTLNTARPNGWDDMGHNSLHVLFWTRERGTNGVPYISNDLKGTSEINYTCFARLRLFRHKGVGFDQGCVIGK